MKKVLKQIGKAIGYFAVYLTCMNVVDLIAGFVWGYSKGKEFKEMGLSPDEAAAAFQSVETGYKGISMLIGAILTLLVFFIIEKVKKTSLAKETDEDGYRQADGPYGRRCFRRNVLHELHAQHSSDP